MPFSSKGLLSRFALAATLGSGAALLLSGCNEGFNVIDHVSFAPSADLQSVRLSLVFANPIHTQLSGSLNLGNYGFLFLNPYTPSESFEVGFALDTAVLADANYAKLTPTQLLPNGLPMGLPDALARVQDPTPVSSQYEFSGYVDTAHPTWLGMAVIFSFVGDLYFPNGLAVSQVFMRDSAGDPGVVASVFGPTLDHSGKVIRAGGIALFGNIQQLLAARLIGANAKAAVLHPELLPIVTGPRAATFEGHYARLRGLEASLVRAFNQKL